jgi:transposase
LEDAENGLTTIARQIFNELYEDLGAREERIAQIERSIRALGSPHEVVHRLETAPGIGYLSATALFATVGDAKQYKNGRQLAASIGLVPRQSSSGGKQRLLGITKRGDKKASQKATVSSRERASAVGAHRPYSGRASMVLDSPLTVALKMVL